MIALIRNTLFIAIGIAIAMTYTAYQKKIIRIHTFINSEINR